MVTFLVVLLIIDSLILALAILVQSGKGGGLAASFGGATTSAEAFMGLRQAGNLFTKLSWWCGGIFLFLAFVISLLSVRARAPESVLDRAFDQPAVPAQTTPATTAPAPAVPLEPAQTPSPAPQP
jgi:preprotein translocase subunit SecG